MSYGQHHWPAALRAVLEECSDSLDQVEPNRWEFYLGFQRTLPITALLVEDWFVLRATWAEDNPRMGWTFWDLLQWNGKLPGGAKFALGGCGPLIQVRAEIPLIENMDLNARMRQACAGFTTAWSQLQGDFDGAVRNEPVGSAELTGDLARLCQETGWSCIEQSAGPIKIDLETPNEFYQARIERRLSQIHVQVEIAAAESISALCRQSLALFLLATSSHLRMARPVVETDGRVLARLEVAFDRSPSGQEISHALAALSVGCQLAGRESVALLQDEELAREYLSLWRADRCASEWHAVENSNQLTKASIGAEKGETV